MMRNSLLIASLSSLLIAQPVIATAETEQSHHIFVTTNTNQVAEVCPELKAGQILQFEFKTKHDVEFNLHYHQGEDVEYPIKPHKISTFNSSFKAPIDQTYCLMWKGLSDKPSKIQIKYNIEQPDTQALNINKGGEAIAMYQPPAKYPTEAKDNNIEGEIVFLFDISPEGRPINLKVISENPKGVFKKAATDAISKWVFKPKIVNTKPVVQKRMYYKMEFRLNN